MKRLFLAVLAALIPHLVGAAAPRVTIVIGENTSALEKRAADDLASELKQLFAAETTTQTAMPGDDSANIILLGSPASNTALKTTIGDAWPKLSDQGHLLKSIKTNGRTALVIGGGSPVATLWAVHELGYRFGIRHMLHGDYLPVEKPAFTLDGFDVILEPRTNVRAWSAFNGQPYGAEAWGLEDQKRLLAQLAKLKFTHLIVHETLHRVPAIRVDGDTPGRKAFQGDKEFKNPDAGDDYLVRFKAMAADVGLVAVASLDKALHISPSGGNAMLLPQADVEGLATAWTSYRGHDDLGFVLRFNVPGEHNASVHFFSRETCRENLTAAQSLSDLVTPICGKEVDARLFKGFAAAAKASALIASNGASPGTDLTSMPREEPALGSVDARMIARHLASKEPPPAWWAEAKTLYTEAMNEMYRGNTRARDGARPFILYHAKRFEFAVHYLTSIEAVRKAGNARAAGNKEAQLEALDQAVEAMHNALNALGDVARDPSDRGVIAVLNEHACRPLIKALEEASNE